MTALADRALVLRAWDFSETSQTVSLFTREHGALRGLAKGARREKSTFGGGFEPLTIGEVSFRLRPTSELALLTEWKVTDIFWGPRTTLAAHRAAWYAAELLGAFITDRDPHPPLFEAADAFLRQLDRADSVPEALARLQWAVLLETGHRPRIEAAGHAAAPPDVLGFDPEAGALAPDPGPRAPADGPVWRIRRETIEILRSLDAALPLDTATPPAVSRANRFLATWCRYLLGTELQTFRVVFG